MTASVERGSKVFELSKRESRAAGRPERRKFNVFATSGVATAMKRLRMAFSWSPWIAQ